jgi:chromosomal replication initiation ATPase DnaA
MSEQLSFDLPVVPALGRDDFMIAPSNAVAVAMMETTPNWPQGKMVLCGPEGSGKTHLAHVWAGAHQGQIVAAADIADADIQTLSQAPVAVEDLPEIAQNDAAQTALFHLHNLMQDTGQPLLMTGTGAPNHWGMGLPDLQSRIDASGIAKHFSDRQLMPRPDVIPYLILRIDRSFAAARDVVAAMDSQSLARHQPLTRALAAQVLDNLG